MNVTIVILLILAALVVFLIGYYWGWLSAYKAWCKKFNYPSKPEADWRTFVAAVAPKKDDDESKGKETVDNAEIRGN